MKKTNNKFRSNGGNSHHSTTQVYSLNYKFDSHSMAGKCCDTALNLIKRYNDLARDAIGNGDRVASEMFRQYAEHYRKILTDINEKRVENNSFITSVKREENPSQEVALETPKEEKPKHYNKFKRDDKPRVQMPRKELKIVEVDESAKNSVEENILKPIPKPKRIVRKKEETSAKEESVA